MQPRKNVDCLERARRKSTSIVHELHTLAKTIGIAPIQTTVPVIAQLCQANGTLTINTLKSIFPQESDDCLDRLLATFLAYDYIANCYEAFFLVGENDIHSGRRAIELLPFNDTTKYRMSHLAAFDVPAATMVHLYHYYNDSIDHILESLPGGGSACLKRALRVVLRVSSGN